MYETYACKPVLDLALIYNEQFSALLTYWETINLFRMKANKELVCLYFSNEIDGI